MEEKLLCHTDLVMFDGTKRTTKGKYYTIVSKYIDIFGDIMYQIMDDGGLLHDFSINQGDQSYYRRWFYNKKELRKLLFEYFDIDLLDN